MFSVRGTNYCIFCTQQTCQDACCFDGLVGRDVGEIVFVEPWDLDNVCLLVERRRYEQKAKETPQLIMMKVMMAE